MNDGRAHRTGAWLERRQIGLYLAALIKVVAIYLLFLALMIPAGIGIAWLFRPDIPASRAIVYSGATRNSLVALPLALALPASLSLPRPSLSPKPWWKCIWHDTGPSSEDHGSLIEPTPQTRPPAVTSAGGRGLCG